jgi:LemA protein
MALAGVGVLLLIWFLYGWNRLIGWRRQALRSWADIDVALQRRAQLVPNLVETVRAAASHEQQLLEEAVQARSEAVGASSRRGRIDGEEHLDKVIPKLFVLAERYPELRTSENFRQLQRSLIDLEEQIADARESYNQAVTNYNEAQEAFPLNIVAAVGGRVHMPLYEAEAHERKLPRVQVEAGG